MHVHLNIDFNTLEADGDFAGGEKESRLSGTLVLNGRHYFHIAAVQVQADNRTEAVNPDLQSWIDAINDINSDACEPLDHDGRHYVTIIHPYAS